MCGFCLKKLLKACDYDESVQSACDTQWRMNGHVKSMHFQQFMGPATSKFCHASVLTCGIILNISAFLNCW